MSSTLVKEGKEKAQEVLEEEHGPQYFSEQVSVPGWAFCRFTITVPEQKSYCQEKKPYVLVKASTGQVERMNYDGKWTMDTPPKNIGINAQVAIRNFVKEHSSEIKRIYLNNKKYGKD